MSPISLPWCWRYLQIFSFPRGHKPREATSLQCWGWWTHTHHPAWRPTGGGNCTPGPHLHTWKPHLTWLIWDTILGGIVSLGSPSAVLCRTRPLVNRQSYCLRTSCLETFPVSKLKAGVIWGDFSWMVNPGSQLRKTVHLITNFICCFPTCVAFTPGLHINESDFHHHLHLMHKLCSVGTTVNYLKRDAQ